MTGKQPFEAIVSAHGSTLLRVTSPAAGDAEPDAAAELTQALAKLPTKQKQAIAYHYLAGLPYAEVAAIVGGSADAARRAAADGIAALRRSYPGARHFGAPGERGQAIPRSDPGVPDDLDRLSLPHDRLAAPPATQPGQPVSLPGR
jgi:hypothetical protein